MYRLLRLKSNIVVVFAVLMQLLSACSSNKTGDFAPLENNIKKIIADKKGQFGIAIIIDNKDTFAFNNVTNYPLMSMFKLHQAIAVCNVLSKSNTSLDSVITIRSNEIDTNTWSPMLKKYSPNGFDISIKDLIMYLMVDSDNNASNILFDRIVNVANTDSIIASAISPERGFKLIYKEADMSKDHSLAYSNVTSPMSFARLVHKVFTDTLTCKPCQEYIKYTMQQCQTGMNRIAAGLPKDKNITFAHRTGSGYTNEKGEIAAVNDGGFITLPNGKTYTVVILVKDYKGTQEEVEKVIAEISKTIYQFICSLN